ncbi:Hypothetical protein CINCED_3A007347 [Cinara cedri]|uniref:Uncharacterized protein n=1 Tax=Cinara cedri TaxID=506608 RepID=A0A5E4NF82_9HEMI|nr:Hypothetical protein CINCED_3A007347 [Cinara cedri]
MPLQGDRVGGYTGGGSGRATMKLGAVVKAVAVTVAVDRETAARSTKDVRNGKEFVNEFPGYGGRRHLQLPESCILTRGYTILYHTYIIGSVFSEPACNI